MISFTPQTAAGLYLHPGTHLVVLGHFQLDRSSGSFFCVLRDFWESSTRSCRRPVDGAVTGRVCYVSAEKRVLTIWEELLPLLHTRSFTHTHTGRKDGCQAAAAALRVPCAVPGRGSGCLRSLVWELQERRGSGSGAAQLSCWGSSPFPLFEESGKEWNRGKTKSKTKIYPENDVIRCQQFFFIYYYYYFASKGVGKVQIGAVFFNLEEFSKFMLPSGKIASYSTCFHFCFRPDGIFKLLHVHSRMSLPFLFLYKRLVKSFLAGFCRCRTQNTHASIVLQKKCKSLGVSVSSSYNQLQTKKIWWKITIKLPLATFKKLAIGWIVS